MQFAQFLVRDDEPLLFHTGPRRMFPLVHQAVERLIDPATLRWIGLSHFEADECGSLNEWLAIAPHAAPLCSMVAAMVSIQDIADRSPRVLVDGETLETGRKRFQLVATPHVPHGWDAALLFEERDRTLFCSDLFHQLGDVEPSTESDVVGRARDTLRIYEAGPFAHYLPHPPYARRTLEGLAALRPQRLAAMHGSTYVGDGARALRDFATMLDEVLGPASG